MYSSRRLAREAYEAGAWHWEGSFIGAKLRVALTLPDRDRPQEMAGETAPTWVLNAYYAAVYALTGDLMPAGGEKEEVERDARILAEEIEREAEQFRKAAKARQRPTVSMTEEDKLILDTLADDYPAAVNQPDLEGLTGISRQKISKRLMWLEAKPRCFVERPKDTRRKGHAITMAGLSAIGRPVESPH